MLKTRVVEKHKPSNKILELFNSTNMNYTITNGYTQIIEKTNIVQVFPIVYKFNNLAIYEFPKEYTKKPYYVVGHNMNYNFNELLYNLTNLF